MLKRIVITGGDGRFAQILKKNNKKLNIHYPGKKELDILNLNSIKKYLKIYQKGKIGQPWFIFLFTSLHYLLRDI